MTVMDHLFDEEKLWTDRQKTDSSVCRVPAELKMYICVLLLGDIHISDRSFLFDQSVCIFTEIIKSKTESSQFFIVH